MKKMLVIYTFNGYFLCMLPKNLWYSENLNVCTRYVINEYNMGKKKLLKRKEIKKKERENGQKETHAKEN